MYITTTTTTIEMPAEEEKRVAFLRPSVHRLLISALVSFSHF